MGVDIVRHIVITTDGTTFSGYLDGILQETLSDTSLINIKYGFGYFINEEDRRHKGTLSNVRIYNDTKDQAFIDKLYAEGPLYNPTLQTNRIFGDTLIDDSVIETRVNMSATGNKMIELKGDIYRES
jgi:hypothetical protein